MAETRGLQKIDSALKGLTQNLTYSEITHRGSMLKKEPESDTLANLRLPKRSEATGTPPGDTDAGRAILESSFCHKKTSAGKSHFESSL